MPPEQEQILMWGLSLQPSVRPQNMETLASRLEETLIKMTQMSVTQMSVTQMFDVPEQTGGGEVMNNGYPVENPMPPAKVKSFRLPLAIAITGAVVIAVVVLLCLL